MKLRTPDYRQFYKPGNTDQTDETPLSLLNKVLLAGLRALAEDGDYETLGALHLEKWWLMNENGLSTRYSPETGEREVYMMPDSPEQK